MHELCWFPSGCQVRQTKHCDVVVKALGPATVIKLEPHSRAGSPFAMGDSDDWLIGVVCMGIIFSLHTKTYMLFLYFPKRPLNRLPTNSSILLRLLLLLLLLLLLFRARCESAIWLLLLSHTPRHRRIRSLPRICRCRICKRAMVCGLGSCVAGLQRCRCWRGRVGIV